MSRSAYREIDPNAFSDDSTWMNLGLWERDSPRETFTEANVRLARAIARHLAQNITVLVDLGCGRGDSIELWLDSFPSLRRVFGVNYSQEEQEEASARFSGDHRVSIVHSDAVDFLESGPRLEKFGIVSVDAAYHFNPDRIAFLTAARATNATCLACSDITLSEKWAREENRLDFFTQYRRHGILTLVCAMAGIPRANLTYGPTAFKRLLQESGWEVTHFEIVTESVFVPFSEYCFTRAKKFPWYSRQRWSALSSGAFMRFLDWMNAVDFIIYAAVPA